ncbi:MAG TPA: sucrase ferredoxin [Pseudonocardia sp.]|jgi:hypothetical protein|nr:sucrase ferredoxin [Pseudonocardia sp.]
MTVAVGQRCASVARALGEPLGGTGPTAARWLCLEHPEPWPRDVSRHPDPKIKALLDRATSAGFRPLLIRRSDGTTGTSRRVLMADTDPGRTAGTMHTVTEPADIPLPAPGDPLPGVPTPPALLVCTHAERDPCCGTDGRALVDALAAAGVPDVWECSHLGGHRFAATALVLPAGYLYGHLGVDGVIAVRTAIVAGAVVTEGCRGRSTWSAAGQVAELAVRAATGISAVDALTVHPDDGGTVLVSNRSGVRWSVELTASDSDTVRPASCGARPTLVSGLHATAVVPLPR